MSVYLYCMLTKYSVNPHQTVLWPHLCQNVHSLQHSLHLALLLSCKYTQQRLQLTRLHSWTQMKRVNHQNSTWQAAGESVLGAERQQTGALFQHQFQASASCHQIERLKANPDRVSSERMSCFGCSGVTNCSCVSSQDIHKLSSGNWIQFWHQFSSNLFPQLDAVDRSVEVISMLLPTSAFTVLLLIQAVYCVPTDL